MPQESSVFSTWQALSNQAADAIEKAGRPVVAVHARRRIPASGVHWRPGIVVTASHALEREEEITVTLADASAVPATLAGRDPGTDLAILKIAVPGLPVAELGDVGALKSGHIVLAAGRTSEGAPRASLAMVAVSGPAWRAWSGGMIDQTLRLDRNLHPNLSGGPLVDSEGKILGINTPALSRFAAVVIPASTVDRVAQELEKKGHIGRGFLGVAMQAVPLPAKLRELLKRSDESGVMIVAVEPDGPAEKAGVLIGDLVVALDGHPVRDTDEVQSFLTSEQVGRAVRASLVRGGAPAEATITVGERPAPQLSSFRGRRGSRGHGRFRAR